MSIQLLEKLSPRDAGIILECLPERIKIALINRADEIDYPIEAILEMAIASFLDENALSFVDCKPEREY